MRQVFSRHPIISVFWIPPFAMLFVLVFVFVRFSPMIRDTAHVIPFSFCQKSTGTCTTYYITPFEHLLYQSMFVLAVPSFLIFWVLGAVASIRSALAAKR